MTRLRMTAIIAGVFLASILSSPAFAYQTSLSIDPTSSSVSVGNSVTLDVDISNVTNLYAFQFDLSYAPGTLSSVSIVEGSFLPTVGAV